MIGRLINSFQAFTGRTKIGGLQGALIYNLARSGVDAPRVHQLISEIAATAWNIGFVGEYFKRMGFSFEDYQIMYRAAVAACPDILLEEKNLIATFLLVDNCHRFESGFRAIYEATSELGGDERSSVLASLMARTTNDIANSHPDSRKRD
jgi:hypothetical protein